ncbi:thioredoxin [Ancylostoma caninum]|uniref:Sulfhydryl oxidase n=1 Tax=Ancylostoma caninum TaxID=29170 RepID=A0A368GWH2_ANCCA|nr:thioredoxin [Ancylostoma caninum]
MLLALFALVHTASAAVSSFNYVPLGSNPTLYTPGFEPIMHLDQHTFADTVFGQDRAFLVEFYADWCGHCRAFAPHFRQFATLVKEWNPIVTVAVINCADVFNAQTCRDNGIAFYPMLKYFPRNARTPSQARNMDTPHSADAMREALMRMVANEYSAARYPDWPNLSHIYVDGRTTYGQLWDGVPESADYLAIIFEEYDGVGVQFILDLSSRRRMVGARRALSSSPLVQMLRIVEFPTVALFRRDHQQALYMQRFSNHTYIDIDNVIMNDARNSHAFTLPPIALTTTMRPTTTQVPLVDCSRFPDRCREMYYVSETDMLKAMRMALYDEVVRTPGYIQGDNFTGLTDFVTLLSNHFPVLSFTNDIRRSKRTTSTILKNSERARLVFIHMREYLESRRNRRMVSVDDYKRQFENVERVYANPFPTNSSWQHCKGTTPMFRGYTCGLWTTFHALTVHTYIDTIKDTNVNALKPLKSIQGWVKGFFGCQHCKRHFMNMTTNIFPMTERRIRHPHDMMTYLWRAHNIVNNRLHGDPTEDPQFIKMQFPPPFLCPTCHSGGQFSRRQVRNFLLRYYGSIKPHNRLADRRLAFF